MAIMTVQKALADSIVMLNESAPNNQVLTLKSLEALQKVADGKATKLIIPSEIQNLAGLVASVKELTDEKYVYDNDFDPAGWFRNCYGIVRDNTVEVEKIVIRAFGKEVNYMRDLPLHSSQKEVVCTEKYSDFELMLSPTADFWTPLVSRGPAIKVLEPQWLADEIKRLHQEAVNLYE